MRHLHPVEGESQRSEASADIRRLAMGIMRYRWWALAIALVFASLVTAWTLRMPKIYQATATLEYDPNPSSPLGSKVEDTSSIGHFLISKEFFTTQNRILESRSVAERVVDRLGLTSDPDFVGTLDHADDAGIEARQDAAQRIQGMLEVEPVKDTRLVYVHIRDANPERAVLLANTLADAYIEKTVEDRLGSSVNAANWLAERLDNTRKQLSESEIALHTYKQDHNILSVSLEDRQNLLAGEIQSFNERLTDTRARRIELQARLERLRAISKAQPESVSPALLGDNEALTELRTAILEKSSEHASLSVRYGKEHPSIKELEGELAALRGSLQAEIKSLVHAADADLSEVRRVEKGLRSALADAQRRGLELNLREIEFSRLRRQQESDAKLYGLLLQRTAETDLTSLLRTTHVRVVDRALLPEAPVSPMVALNIAGGVLFGLMLGAFVAFLLYQLDRRVQGVQEVEELGLTLLGVFPKIETQSTQGDRIYRSAKRRKELEALRLEDREIERIVRIDPMSIAAESCRTLRTNLTFMAADAPLDVLVVTSPSPREGKTTVACNLAIAFAQNNQRVLLVDADLRRPRLHQVFQANAQIGVTNILVSDKTFDEAVHTTDIPDLDVVPCGPIPPNPAELLHSTPFAKFLAEARRRYDRVILDSPPLEAVTDAAVIAPQCAGAMVVVRAESTTRDAIRGVIRHLQSVNANIIGGVLNNLDTRRKGYGVGGYHYYGGYELTTKNTGDKDEQSAA